MKVADSEISEKETVGDKEKKVGKGYSCSWLVYHVTTVYCCSVSLKNLVVGEGESKHLLQTITFNNIESREEISICDSLGPLW